MREWKKSLIESIKNKSNLPLVFVHIPKTGGSYVGSILKQLGIKNLTHGIARKGEGIVFTVIRDPVERFESLLNYRLYKNTPRDDWPQHLRYVYSDENITLNEIIQKMSDKDILGFTPYCSMTYWSKNVDIFITIEELKEFLEIFDYTYDETEFARKNFSTAVRGTVNQSNKNRIAELYHSDVELFAKWTAHKKGC